MSAFGTSSTSSPGGAPASDAWRDGKEFKYRLYNGNDPHHDFKHFSGKTGHMNIAVDKYGVSCTEGRWEQSNGDGSDVGGWKERSVKSSDGSRIKETTYYAADPEGVRSEWVKHFQGRTLKVVEDPVSRADFERQWLPMTSGGDCRLGEIRSKQTQKPQKTRGASVSLTNTVDPRIRSRGRGDIVLPPPRPILDPGDPEPPSHPEGFYHLYGDIENAHGVSTPGDHGTIKFLSSDGKLTSTHVPGFWGEWKHRENPNDPHGPTTEGSWMMGKHADGKPWTDQTFMHPDGSGWDWRLTGPKEEFDSWKCNIEVKTPVFSPGAKSTLVDGTHAIFGYGKTCR